MCVRKGLTLGDSKSWSGSRSWSMYMFCFRSRYRSAFASILFLCITQANIYSIYIQYIFNIYWLG